MEWTSAKTREWFEARGFYVHSVDVGGVRGRTKDFMGCWDEEAWHADGRTFLIQSTSRDNIQSRRKKIEAAILDPKKRIGEGMHKWLAATYMRFAEIWAWDDKGTARVLTLLIGKTDNGYEVKWAEIEQ